MDIYRNYKLKILPQIRDIGETDITESLLKIDELDNLLIDKVVKSGVIKFTADDEINRMAIKCMLFASNSAYPNKEGTYDNVYLPPDINNTTYIYKGNGILIMQFKDKEGKEISLNVEFDGTQIKGIKEVPIEKEEISR